MILDIGQVFVGYNKNIVKPLLLDTGFLWFYHSERELTHGTI